MVRNDLALFLAHDTVFLFLTDKHLFHGCEQILLGNIFPAVLHRHNGSFINHIGKICTNCTACSQCNRIQIHTLIQMYILRMNLQDLHTSLQVRLIYDNSTVKTSRTKKRLIQNLRTVRSTQYQNTLRSIETIHLRQQLVQRLLTLLITSTVFTVTASPNGINFIDKNNTWCILGCFLKQISYTGSSDTDIQFNKVRSGKREERHLGFSGYCLGQ